jgi:hypothetical protein
MPRKFYTYFIIFIFYFIPFCKLYSQQSDAGMWNTFSIEKRITKKYSIGIDEELRFKENFTRLNLLYTNLGIIFRPNKEIKLAFIYRLIEKYEEDDYFSYRNRLMLDISYKYKIKSFSLSYRSRVQSEVRNYYSSEKGKVPEWFWRNKFEVKYSIKKYSPYVGTELRYQFTDPRNPETDFGWHRIRIFGGVDYKINNQNTCGIYYLIQKEWLTLNPQNLYILGLEYSIDLP